MHLVVRNFVPTEEASNLGIVVRSLVEPGWRGSQFYAVREVDVEVDIIDSWSHLVDGGPIDGSRHVLEPSLDGVGARGRLAHLGSGVRGALFVARGRGFFVSRRQVLFVAQRHGLSMATEGP